MPLRAGSSTVFWAISTPVEPLSTPMPSPSTSDRWLPVTRASGQPWSWMPWAFPPDGWRVVATVLPVTVAPSVCPT